MKSHAKKGILILLVLWKSTVCAQFNTLKPLPTKEENVPRPTRENLPEAGEKVLHEEIGRRPIKLFKRISNAKLKREIDSLKALMLEYTALSNTAQKDGSAPEKGDFLPVITTLQNNNLFSVKTSQNLKVRPTDHVKTLSQIAMPLKNKMIITSPFGNRFHPLFKKMKMHNGADLKARFEPVYAVLDGIITEAGWDSGGGGNYIKVRHSDSYSTSYLHLSEIFYHTGDRVKAGYIIAKSGNSGNSTGAHLHFAVTENGKYINPLLFLQDLLKTNNLIETYYANK